MRVKNRYWRKIHKFKYNLIIINLNNKNKKSQKEKNLKIINIK